MGENDSMDTTPTPAVPAGGSPRRMRRRVITGAAVIGAAFGVGIGATALASAATSPSTTQPAGSGKSPTGPEGGPYQGLGGRFRGGPAGLLGGFGGGPGGGVVHGQYTVKGPNGYETIDIRNGTVSALSNTSGSTWSLTVKSADGTSGTYTVNSSTSVNGGESGIASVKSGDTVSVTGTESGGTTTATRITDSTTLEANGKSWMPTGGQPPTGETPGGPGSSTT